MSGKSALLTVGCAEAADALGGLKVNEKGVAGLDSPAVPVWLPSAVFALSLPLRLLPACVCVCACVLMFACACHYKKWVRMCG